MINFYNLIESDKKEASISHDSGVYIHDFIIKNYIKNTLEIGFGNGCSSAYIISATKSKHIVIDPYQKDRWKLWGLKNIKKFNLDQYLVIEEDYAHKSLPILLSNNIKFDFVFFDGSHLFDFIMIDFFYSDLLLKKNGFIMFHDGWMDSVKTTTNWINNNRKDYLLFDKYKNLITYQKIDSDNRKWDHFVKF